MGGGCVTSLTHTALNVVVSSARCIRGSGVRIPGTNGNQFVLAACCNGTGHLTQARVIADTCASIGLECVGVILEEGVSDKLKDEIVGPLGVPCLVLAGVQLVDQKGAISVPRLVCRGAAFAPRLPSAKRQARAFIKKTRAAFVISCWHYSLALLLSTRQRDKLRVLHLAPQFGLDLAEAPRSSGAVESAWRGGLEALKGAFTRTGRCVPIRPGSSFPPLIDAPKRWRAPPASRSPIVLCYFLSTESGRGLVRALNELRTTTKDRRHGAAVFHIFSDPPLPISPDASGLFVHAKSRTAFRELFDKCDGVVTSAGNETVWEAVCRGVRVIAVPTRGHAEQALNAQHHALKFPDLCRARDAPGGADLAWLLDGDPTAPAPAAECARLRAEVRNRAPALRAAIQQALTVKPDFKEPPPHVPDDPGPLAEPPEDEFMARKALKFGAAALGVAFGVDGTVNGLQPGGEAETVGVLEGDVIIKVGERWVRDDAEIRDAVKDHVERPLAVVVARAKEPVLDFRRDAIEVVIDGEKLGLAFEGDGGVKALAPGGEAEAKGILVGDRVVRIGNFWVDSDGAIGRAAKRSPERPLTITVARERGEPAEDPLRDRREIVIEGKSMGIAFCPNGTPGMFAPDSEAEAKGMQYSDRVIKVGPHWVTDQDQIMGAVAATPDRPLTIVVARKKPKGEVDAPPAGDFDIVELALVEE